MAPTRPASLSSRGGVVVPFRRRAVRTPRRRRSLAAVLLRGFCGALLIVGGPAAATAWALSSSHFELSSFQLIGSERVSERWLHERLEPLRGRNLLWLPLTEVDRALAGHPWIGDLEVSKDLPARLIVVVEQRVPAARVPVAGEIWLADSAGEPIAPLGDEAATGLILVTRPADRHGGGPAGDGVAGRGVPLALAVGRELAAAAPAWARELERIEVLSEEDARLISDALPCPLLVRVGSIEQRAERLAVLLAELSARYPGLAALDLRFSRRIVVQPEARTASAGGATVNEREDVWASQTITT